CSASPAPMPRDSKSSTSIVDQLFPRVSQPVVRYGLRVRQARRVAQIGAPGASAALPTHQVAQQEAVRVVG
ncbi:hypothetical protein ACV34S_35130, partial [Pseudomonas aeruginosa]